MTLLTFDKLNGANRERLLTTPKYRPCLKWSEAEWGNALAGETGELCNLLKKVVRGDDVLVDDVAKEIADVVIYADLIAQQFGIDLGEAVRAKFNEVSERVGSDVKL